MKIRLTVVFVCLFKLDINQWTVVWVEGTIEILWKFAFRSSLLNKIDFDDRNATHFPKSSFPD